MSYLFTPPAPTTLPIAGSDELFPIRRVFCVGRNYTEHAREMGADERDPPFFFTKPADAVIGPGVDPAYPPGTSDFHFEGELVVAMAKGGADIAEADVNDHIFGYAVGVDLTRRDLQSDAKNKGRPWDMGKAFDQSGPSSEIHPASAIGHPTKGALVLTVNDEVKQQGDIGDMIWNVPESLSFLSSLVALAPGDLIFTGTPAGVGPMVKGDRLHISIDGIANLVFTVV